MAVFTKVLKAATVSWVTLTVAFSGAHGLVLCFGADGHVAFEIAHEGHCEDAHQEHGHDEQAGPRLLTGSDPECCPPCTDVPLSSDQMSQAVLKVKHGAGAADEMSKIFEALTIESCLIWDNPSAAVSTPRTAPSRASPRLAALRTIVLRT
jgi:hypothetical protein